MAATIILTDPGQGDKIEVNLNESQEETGAFARMVIGAHTFFCSKETLEEIQDAIQDAIHQLPRRQAGLGGKRT